MTEIDKLAATVVGLAETVGKIQAQVEVICSEILVVSAIWQDGYEHGSTGRSARRPKPGPRKRDHLHIV